MRRVTLFFALLLAVATQLVSAQDRTADQGVYTSAQAARGARYSIRIASPATARAARRRFSQVNASRSRSPTRTLLAVFTTIQTTMPRQAPGSLTDTEYVDALAHLLTLNGYPDGMTELAVAGLGDIKVPGRGGSLEFTLVHVVGCLAQTGRVWTLGRATDPIRTRAPEPASDTEAAELDRAPLGQRSFRLQQVYGAPPDGAGRKSQPKAS